MRVNSNNNHSHNHSHPLSLAALQSTYNDLEVITVMTHEDMRLCVYLHMPCACTIYT